MNPSSHNIRGIASMIAAGGTFVSNDTCMKLALAELPPLETLVIRGIFATLWCVPLILLMGQGGGLRHVTNKWAVLRATCEFVAIAIFVIALGHISIADLTAIAQTTPLIVIAGASFFWREHVGRLRAVFITLGIVGALLVAQPGSSLASPYAVLGFAVAIGAALRDLLSRKIAKEIPGLVVTLTTLLTVLTGAAILSFSVETLVMPSQKALLLLLAAGFLVMCGQFFVFLAYRLAQPRVVGPFNYSFTVWAVLSGLFVFGDVPNGLAIAGMALIVASGIAVMLTESVSARG